MPSVYIETTIPSFYYSSRKSAQAIAWRQQTRLWWKDHAPTFELVSSVAVVRELVKAPERRAAPRLALIEKLRMLEIDGEAERIAAYYIDHRLMPRSAELDAMHVALASNHAIEYVLTWNCQHIANANKTKHLAVLNKRLGLPVPQLVTPYNLPSETAE